MAALGTQFPLERISIRSRTLQKGDARQAPRGVTIAARLATLSLIALDRTDKNPNALPLGPSSYVFKGRSLRAELPIAYFSSTSNIALRTSLRNGAPEASCSFSARHSAPNEPSATFKRNVTAVLNESPSPEYNLVHADSPPSSEPTPQSESPVQVIDLALPAMSSESTPGTSRMQLFFILKDVQTLLVWILVDSGSVRNLIDESVYNRLPFKPLIRDPGDVRVIGGNGEALDLKGFAILPIALGLNLIWHEFCVVPNLFLEVFVGADVHAPQLCSFLYFKHNKKRLQLGIQVCLRCFQYRTDPDIGSQKQLRFVYRSLKRKRNRLKVGYNFLATLPEAVFDDSDNEQLKEVNKGQAPSVGPEGPELHQTDDPSLNYSIAPVAVKPLAQSEMNKTSGTTTPKEPDQSGKLQRVLSDLKIAALPIPDELRKPLIEVV